MKPGLVGTVAVIAAGGAVVLLEQRRHRSESQAGRPQPTRSRWLAVTVDRPPQELWPDDELPAPLRALGAGIEVEVRPAPGDKGAEIRARLRDRGPRRDTSVSGQGQDADRVRRLRRALRESKQLVEVGEVLRVDPTPHGRRSNTPMGAAVEFATKRAPEEGLL